MKFFFFSLLLCTAVTAQQPDSSIVYDFFLNYTAGNDVSGYLLPDEKDASERLGIHYKGITNKAFIAKDISKSDQLFILKNPGKLHLTYFPLEDEYWRVHAGIPDRLFEMEFIWKGNHIVSKPRYYSRQWERSESKYFLFVYSKPENYNRYAAAFMDNKIDEIAHTLNYSPAEMQKLEEKKIIYFLCSDEEEVKLLTGYEARGIYQLSHDYIVSSYNTHVHEAAHLLMNYKLKNLHLYFHPFLQEGFAVAMGGRGGKSIETMLRLGAFTILSGFSDYPQILTIKNFIAENSSIVYPTAGLYTAFLFKNMDLDKYLNVYTTYSDSVLLDPSVTIDSTLLPTYKEWREFLDVFENKKKPIIISGIPDEAGIINDSEDFFLAEDNDYYYFKTALDLLITDNGDYPGYESSKFLEVYPDGEYNGEKYLITATEQEVSLYNLLTNALTGKYALGLSREMKEVTSEDDKFIFGIRKDLFDEAPERGNIKFLD